MTANILACDLNIFGNTGGFNWFHGLKNGQDDYLTLFACDAEQGFIMIHPCLLELMFIKDECHFAKRLLE